MKLHAYAPPQGNQPVHSPQKTAVQAPPQAPVRRQLIILDSRVDDPDVLLMGLAPTAQVLILNPEQDGIAQITAILQGFSDCQELHLFCHGFPGGLIIGSTMLTQSTLQCYGPVLQTWFGGKATLALYGCRVAMGAVGNAFLDALHELTGASIVASSTLVGHDAKGGRWVLDAVRGESAPLAIALSAQQAYPHVLNAAPVAEDETYVLTGDQPLNIQSLQGVLLNDSDADGDRIGIEAGTFETRHCGSVVLNFDGSFSYTARAPRRGIDSFEYTLFDGNGGTDIGTVTILLNPGADTDGDGVADADDLDTDNDGIPNVVEQRQDPHRDTDGDCLVDWLDLDSDGDGIFDLVEAGYGDRDADGDGRLDGENADFGTNGLLDALETAPDSGIPAREPTNTDGDSVSDFQDLDADNDSISDLLEAGGRDPDGDGLTAGPDSDADGIVDAVDPDGGTPLLILDSDSDARPDYQDLDSDNDGIPDQVEATADTAGFDGSGAIAGPDSDGDGIADAVDERPDAFGNDQAPLPLDSNGDGILDSQALDSDGDGRSDRLEADLFTGEGTPDSDGDGQIDNPIDSDGDGIADGVDSQPEGYGGFEDTDGDGVVDLLDPETVRPEANGGAANGSIDVIENPDPGTLVDDLPAGDLPPLAGDPDGAAGGVNPDTPGGAIAVGEDTTAGDAIVDDATVGDTTVGDATVGDATVGDATVGDTTLGDTPLGPDDETGAIADDLPDDGLGAVNAPTVEVADNPNNITADSTDGQPTQPSPSAGLIRPLVIINEWSQGLGRGQEWVELLVLDDGQGPTANLQNAVLSDTDRDMARLQLSGPGFARLPVGTTLVIYNGNAPDEGLSPKTSFDPAAGDLELRIPSTNTSGEFAITALPSTTGGTAWSGDAEAVNAEAFDDDDPTDAPVLMSAESGFATADAQPVDYEPADAIATFYGLLPRTSPTQLPPSPPAIGGIGAGQSFHYLGASADGVATDGNWVRDLDNREAAGDSRTPGKPNAQLRLTRVNGPDGVSYIARLGSQPTVAIALTVAPDERTDLGNGFGNPVTLTFTPENWYRPQRFDVAIDDAGLTSFTSRIRYSTSSENADSPYGQASGVLLVEHTTSAALSASPSAAPVAAPVAATDALGTGSSALGGDRAVDSAVDAADGIGLTGTTGDSTPVIDAGSGTGTNALETSIADDNKSDGSPRTARFRQTTSGTLSDDILNGFSDADRLRGGSGNDVLNGNGSPDQLVGGADDDILNGGTNDDRLLGGGGNDRLNGGQGRDRLMGGAGRDLLNGGTGDDRLMGGAGRDLLNGGTNDDRLVGGGGNDRLNGGSGDDLLFGGGGRDVLFGGQGSDRFGYKRSQEFGDVITDFEILRDHIDLRQVKGIRTLEDIDLSQRGDDALIRVSVDGRSRLVARLADVNADTLGARHFIF